MREGRGPLAPRDLQVAQAAETEPGESDEATRARPPVLTPCLADAAGKKELEEYYSGLWGRRVTLVDGGESSFQFGNTASGVKAGNGDTRTISIRHMHTKEEVTVTFKRDGRYVAEGLEKLNWALRDWRTDEPIRMDPGLFDVAWEVQRQVGSEQPFHVVSAYRSPGTNSMLRRRSRVTNVVDQRL